MFLIAKPPEAKTHLGKQFFDHTTERTYNALVWGTFTEDSGTVEGALARDNRDRTIYRIWDIEENPNAKEAITHWRVLERFPYVTLVECRLETGRTHQIRVQRKRIRGYDTICTEADNLSGIQLSLLRRHHEFQRALFQKSYNHHSFSSRNNLQ